MRLKILVIDDELTIRKTFKLRLSKWGYDVHLASDGTSGMELLSNNNFDVVISDIKLPGIPGNELVKLIKERFPDIEIIVITGFASVELAVEVMKCGVCDFLCKPLDFSLIRALLKRINERLCLKYENRLLKESVSKLQNELGQKYNLGEIVGKSKSMKALFKLIETVAPLDSTVLISGETGTGKELIAKTIHYNSPRASGHIITVDCGALTETLLESELFGHKKGAFTGAQSNKRGLFEQADGGTIFLDEISNASYTVQQKLLRLIEEKSFQRLGDESVIKVDVRIIAASNEDLIQLVQKGKFRQDLFYRLNVIPIYLPPLRERKEDIPILARYFLDFYSQQLGRDFMELHIEAITQLLSHSWPGNVRELSNVMERTAILTSGNIIRKIFITEIRRDESTISFAHPSLDTPLKDQIAELERNYLKLAMERYHGRVNKVVQCSGVNTRTFFRKLRRYNLDKKDYR
jgi:DNA-binding NtrC family response regulator